MHLPYSREEVVDVPQSPQVHGGLTAGEDVVHLQLSAQALQGFVRLNPAVPSPPKPSVFNLRVTISIILGHGFPFQGSWTVVWWPVSVHAKRPCLQPNQGIGSISALD